MRGMTTHTAAGQPMPRHLLPSSCHVCGSTTVHPAAADHVFWSNAEADAAATAVDARTTVIYPGGATTPEANFVDTTRGR